MVSLSPQLSKIILAFLLLTPWFSLYQKILFPHLAQTGFDGSVITLVELIFVIFISIFGQHPRVTKHGAYLLVAISGWHISGFISAYLSEHFYPSLIKQIEYLIHCMFAYSVWVFLSQTQKQEKMAWFLVFTFVWVIYYILCAWHINNDAFHFNWVNGTPMFNNIRHLGYLQIAIFPFLFLPLIKNISHKHIYTFILLTIFWSSVIWSGARSTFLVTIFSSFVLAWFHQDKRLIVSIYLLSTAVAGWFIALQFQTDSPSMDPYRLLFLNNAIEGASANQISSGRLNIWHGILIETWDKNIWFGLGADPYSFISPMVNSSVSQAHNVLVELFSSIGVIGIFFVILSIYLICRLWQASNTSSNVNKTAQISILSVITASMLDGHFYHTFSAFWIMIIFALSFPPSVKKSDSTNTHKFYMPVLFIALSVIATYNIQKHWNVYIQQQFPLEYHEQFDMVSNYPSYYRPISWIYSEQSTPDLRAKAISLGKKHGPRFCNYYLIEFLESDTSVQSSLSENILKRCSIGELKATNNEKILKLISQDSL